VTIKHQYACSARLLGSALQFYDGAIIAISHDERFLEAIGIERQVGLGERVEVRGAP